MPTLLEVPACKICSTLMRMLTYGIWFCPKCDRG